MADDDLLREASDPATPSERLQGIIDEARARPGAIDPAVVEAINGNPSAPLPYLALLLRAGVLTAWYNPAAHRALELSQRPIYEAAALRALKRLSASANDGAPKSATSLAEAVARWARPSDWGGPSGRDDPAARAFARHLAGLFGLPWPEEAP